MECHKCGMPITNLFSMNNNRVCTHCTTEQVKAKDKGEIMGKSNQMYQDQLELHNALKIAYEEGVYATFQKKDIGKNRLELIEPSFIEDLGQVLTFGANKYEANNWKLMSSSDVERVKGSLLRHTLSYLKGIEYDDETGFSQLAHMACNLMFLDYFDKNKVRDYTIKGNICQE